jgi:hypothetical protein
LIDNIEIEHGHTFITSSEGKTNQVNGFINSPFIIKYSEKKSSVMTFELPNFKDFFGDRVKINGGFRSNRLEFKNKDWAVIIDKVDKYEALKKNLENEGGYALLFTGVISSKTISLDAKEFQELNKQLGLFLSFLNGRRSFPCFLQTNHFGLTNWIDYSAFYVDRYKSVGTWLPQADFSGLDEMWDNYLTLIKDPNRLECIDYLLHWYFEANNNSGFSEGAIVLLQNAFELLFNWQIVEEKKMFTKKEAKEINAAEKIRLLLKYANIPIAVPPRYSKIETDLKSKKIQYSDFPELFTLIRNSIVHANHHKRLSLAKIPSMSRYHVKEIALCYLELLLLNLLGYKGKYANRISENMFVGGNEEFVPWVE